MTADGGAGVTSRLPEAGAPAAVAARDRWAWLRLENGLPLRQRASGVTLAAVTLIVIQVGWMAALLGRSYFRQDDYFLFDRARTSGFTWNYLMLVHAGHLSPIGSAIAWAVARVSLYNWPLACAVVLGLLAAADFALLRALRTLFGDRPAILIPLVVGVFTPLSLTALAWWSVAIQAVPLELAIVMSVDAHVRYLHGGRLRCAVAAAGWMLFGMAALEKGALIPVLLFALTSAFFVEGRWAVALVRTARRHWRAWLLYGLLLAGYCALFLIRLRGAGVRLMGPGWAAYLAGFGAAVIGTTLVPGALGGPWRWFGSGYPLASPPAALQQLSWAVAAFVVMISSWYRVRAWRAWAILFGWVAAADILTVLAGQPGPQSAALLGAQARFVTDAAAVLALCLGFAFLPVAGLPVAGLPVAGLPVAGLPVVGGQGAGGLRGHAVAPADPATWTGRAAAHVRAVPVLVLGLFLAGSFWSAQAFEAAANTRPARSYIATARVAVAGAPRGTLIVDGPTPSMIMDPALFWREGYTSRVIGALAQAGPARRLRWTLSPRGVIRSLMIFDSEGRLRPAVVAGPSSGPPPRGRRCWPVTAAASRIPVRGSLYRWSWTVRLSYSGPATVLAVRFGGDWADVTIPSGTHAVYVPVVGAGRAVDVRLAGPWPARCLTGVTVGSLHPAEAGRAIPAAPVPG